MPLITFLTFLLYFYFFLDTFFDFRVNEQALKTPLENLSFTSKNILLIFQLKKLFQKFSTEILKMK